MRYALLALGVVAVIVAVVLAVGWSLPVGHRATREAVFRAPPETVYAAITDVAALPSWRPSVTGVEILPAAAGGARRFREVGSDGAITYAVDEAVPPRRLVTRIDDPSLPFGGRWTYELAPAAGGGTALRITEDGEVYNPVFRVVSRFVMGHHATMDRYLADLARRLGEGGAAPAGAP